MKKIFFSLALLLLTSITVCAQTTFTHPWHGKRIAYFGDSITDPRVLAGTQKWWTILSEMLSATSYCYAISGRQWNDIPRQTEALTKEHGQDVDAILIFMGTNDFNAGVPLGEWYDVKRENVEFARGGQQYVQEREHRYMAYNDSTYKGRINKALLGLKKAFPTKQIVILTPIHRAYFASGKGNVQPDELWPNKLGNYLEEYTEALKEAGRIWAMPVIDLSSICGLYPLADEHAQYFSNPERDRLHPNDAGYDRIARTLYYQLVSLPCGFE